eukprot:TRINITY_DN60073_c0_g3_i1.p1 TRINITY_DN60073_c0_g3~~TRINITY_DN60073_c0_g3_i1.p1  ORF type:complete len:920 (-),score=88.52 TRINITY_DN60073_c0_g3_i1:63-2570(-)
MIEMEREVAAMKAQFAAEAYQQKQPSHASNNQSQSLLALPVKLRADEDDDSFLKLNASSNFGDESGSGWSPFFDVNMNDTVDSADLLRRSHKSLKGVKPEEPVIPPSTPGTDLENEPLPEDIEARYLAARQKVEQRLAEEKLQKQKAAEQASAIPPMELARRRFIENRKKEINNLKAFAATRIQSQWRGYSTRKRMARHILFGAETKNRVLIEKHERKEYIVILEWAYGHMSDEALRKKVGRPVARRYEMPSSSQSGGSRLTNSSVGVPLNDSRTSRHTKQPSSRGTTPLDLSPVAPVSTATTGSRKASKQGQNSNHNVNNLTGRVQSADKAKRNKKMAPTATTQYPPSAYPVDSAKPKKGSFNTIDRPTSFTPPPKFTDAYIEGMEMGQQHRRNQKKATPQKIVDDSEVPPLLPFSPLVLAPPDTLRTSWQEETGATAGTEATPPLPNEDHATDPEEEDDGASLDPLYNAALTDAWIPDRKQFIKDTAQDLLTDRKSKGLLVQRPRSASSPVPSTPLDYTLTGDPKKKLTKEEATAQLQKALGHHFEELKRLEEMRHTLQDVQRERWEGVEQEMLLQETKLLAEHERERDTRLKAQHERIHLMRVMDQLDDKNFELLIKEEQLRSKEEQQTKQLFEWETGAMMEELEITNREKRLRNKLGHDRLRQEFLKRLQELDKDKAARWEAMLDFSLKPSAGTQLQLPPIHANQTAHVQQIAAPPAALVNTSYASNPFITPDGLSVNGQPTSWPKTKILSDFSLSVDAASTTKSKKSMSRAGSASRYPNNPAWASLQFPTQEVAFNPTGASFAASFPAQSGNYFYPHNTVSNSFYPADSV